MEPVVFRVSSAAVITLWVLGGVGALISLYLIRRKKALFGSMLLFLSLFILLILAPLVSLDIVTIDSTRLYRKTGFWFKPTITDLHFKDIDFIRITHKPRGVDGRVPEIWEVHFKNGQVADIEPGDLWLSHDRQIVDLLVHQGLKISKN